MREGYYTDQYFNLTRDLLELEGHRPRVLLQVFQKQEAILGGVDEAIAVLKQCAGRHVDGGWEEGWDELEVRALHEGDEVSPRETVMTIEGDYGLFAHLETVYLGCMARRTLVMRNVKAVGDAAHGKPILFFPARHDHWLVQTGDGWAAHVAGAIGVSTDAQASWWGGRGVGTVPHALIAAFGGDTVAAARLFADRYHDETNITVLVDFENDSVRTALEVADALGEHLWGVRLDTSEQLVDVALQDEPDPAANRGVTPLLTRRVRDALDAARKDGPDPPPTRGVPPLLTRRVRDALDAAGHERVRIVVSGGFDHEKIARFEAEAAPVDAYGVGSSLLRGQNDFTADVVRVDGRPLAKAGRQENPNPRLELVD